MRPLISVILPVFNAHDYIGDSIDCILNQTFGDFELIIINDGSEDQSKEIIKSKDDKRVVFVENRKNLGLIKTLNKGIHLARGHYIARMDADDLCHKTRFEKQIDYLNQNKEIEILGTTQYIIGSGRLLKNTLFWEENKIRLLLEPVVGHSTVMMRADSLKKFRLYYDKNALYAEDYKLWVDASVHGLKIQNLAEPLCGYRSHATQISETYREEQFLTAQRIRLLYGVNFFPTIIKMKPITYLQFILNAQQITKEEATEIAREMIQINTVFSYFDDTLFKRFVNARLLYHQSSI